MDASGGEWSYGNEDYDGLRCMWFQREYECDWLRMVIAEVEWNSWRGAHLLMLFPSCRDCIWMNGVVWMRIEEEWRWGRICFRIWGWREDEEMIMWLELNDGIVGMRQRILQGSSVSSAITGRVLRTSFFTWDEWMEEWHEMDWLLFRKSEISLLQSMKWRIVSGETLNPHE